MIRLFGVENGLASVGALEQRRVLTKVRPKTSVLAGGGTLGLSVLSMVSFAGWKGPSEHARMH
jgi:hypothetical protein